MWTLVSSTWSGAPGRALLEYDRALYLSAFALFAAFGFTPERLRWMVRGLAAGMVVVCGCALTTRLAPDIWSVAPTVSASRLSFPLTYWNALGLLAALGLVLCLVMTSDLREAAAIRVLSAAALPVFAATLLLTFSRGSIAAGLLGGCRARRGGTAEGTRQRPARGSPGDRAAVIAAYGAELLTGDRLSTDAAAAQGHGVALVVALCVAAAAALRLALLRLDTALRWRRDCSSVRLPRGRRCRWSSRGPRRG